jgi:hypothetical protein
MIGWMDVNRKHNFPWMRRWMRNCFFMDDKMDLCVDRKHYSWIDRWMMMCGQEDKISLVFLFHGLTIPHAST